MFRSVLPSRASDGQQGESAQGLNRMGAGMGGGSGQLESIEGPRRCWRRCPGGPAQMREDLGEHGTQTCPRSTISSAPSAAPWRSLPRAGCVSEPRLGAAALHRAAFVRGHQLQDQQPFLHSNCPHNVRSSGRPKNEMTPRAKCSGVSVMVGTHRLTTPAAAFARSS
jgi:hypothetical protein